MKPDSKFISEAEPRSEYDLRNKTRKAKEILVERQTSIPSDSMLSNSKLYIILYSTWFSIWQGDDICIKREKNIKQSMSALTI